MIRLKPSEISLTQADVEETRRRMERRQAADALTHGPSLPPTLTARLRRGPKRSRDDAMASLGSIPILKPRQAIPCVIEDPGDAPPSVQDSFMQSFAESSEAVSSESTSPPDAQATLNLRETPTRLDVLLPGSEMQLPFRPAPRDSGSSRFGVQEEIGEDITSSPPKLHLNPPRLSQERTNSSETGNDEASRSLFHPSTDGIADGALETPMRNRASSLRQQHTHAPSPLQHVEMISSPRHQGHDLEEGTTGREARHEDECAADGESSSPRFIRGYWDSHQRYRFIECAPRTDPRPRTQQASRHARTMSSSSEPSYRPGMRRPDTPDPSGEDVFWSTPVPQPPFMRDNGGVQNSTGSSNDRYWSPLGSDGMGYGDPIRNTSGRQSSGTSTTSQPYSFYELPDSRQSSGSQNETLEQSQYDGAGASRQISRGAYYSIRLSQKPPSRAASGTFMRPPPPSRAASNSFPDLTALGQHGLSPLPARPYSRVPSAHHPLIPSTSLVSVADFVGGNQEAMRAFQRDLSSPLELVQERATAYFQRISTRIQAASSQGRTAEPPHHARNQQETVEYQRSDRPRRTSGSVNLRHESGNSAHDRVPSAHPRARMNHGSLPVPPSQDRATVPHRVGQVPARRPVPIAITRAGQRSSENVPVNQPPQESRPRPPQMPTQRATLTHRPSRPSSGAAMRGGELVTSPTRTRLSMPHSARPRDMSNRPHMHSPHPFLLSSDDDPSGSDTLTPVQHPPPGPRIAPRYTSRPDPPPADPPPRPARRAVTPIPGPLPFSRQFERGLPSTSTTLDSAAGVTSRRPVGAVPRAATARRRVVVDQENGEGVEEGGLRGELAEGGVGWRMGRDVGRGNGNGGGGGEEGVMNETPPRVGRYERFVFGE